MYQGFYLNLDRNAERRTALVRHLEQLGVAERYQRLAAVDGRAVADQYVTKLDPGSLGVWLSHAKLVRIVADTKLHVHVIEDDTVFARNAIRNFEMMLEYADAQLTGWDLIFTDIHVPPDNFSLFRDLCRMRQCWEPKTKLTLTDLQPIVFACTSSFFLNRQSIGKYAELMSEKWKVGYPIDVYLRNLVHLGCLKAYLTVPFQTSVSRDALDSDIRGGLDASRVAATIYRRAFFEDANLQSLGAELQELTKDATLLPDYRRAFFQDPALRTLDAEIQGLIKSARLSPLAEIYVRTLLFTLTDRWVQF